MSIYETSITNPKKQLEFYKQLSEQLQQENEKLKADYGTKVQVERDLLKEENKILKENSENNDKVVDKVNWENQLLKKENEQLKDELKNKPDNKIILQDDKGNKFMIIQTERIDMQVELKKIYEKLEDKYIHNVPCCNEEDCGLFKEYQQLKDNWNKLNEWLDEEIQDSLNTWGEVYPRDTYKNVLEQMQEIEGGMNE